MEPRDLLNALMTRAGDNARTLANKSGVPLPTIYNFLTGIAKHPRRSTLERLAKHYGIPTEAFVNETVRQEVAATLLFRQRVRSDT